MQRRNVLTFIELCHERVQSKESTQIGYQSSVKDLEVRRTRFVILGQRERSKLSQEMDKFSPVDWLN
jgi:hypothetical protein